MPKRWPFLHAGDQGAVADLDARAGPAAHHVRGGRRPDRDAGRFCSFYFSHLSSMALFSPASMTFFRPALMRSRTFAFPFFTATP